MSQSMLSVRAQLVLSSDDHFGIPRRGQLNIWSDIISLEVNAGRDKWSVCVMGRPYRRTGSRDGERRKSKRKMI